MGRILFFILLGIAVWMAWRWWTMSTRSVGRRGPDSRVDGEKMVSCEVCGLNLPQSEALPLQQRWFCCEEHRQRGA